MRSIFILSCTAFSLTASHVLFADATVAETQENWVENEGENLDTAASPQVGEDGDRNISLSETPHQEKQVESQAPAMPQKGLISNLKDAKERKKLKAHFAGSKRPPQNEVAKTSAAEESKKSSHVRNEWVVSKTHPKTTEKKSDSNEEALPIEKVLFQPKAPAKELAQLVLQPLTGPSNGDLQEQINSLQQQLDQLQADERDYPRTGVFARRGEAYITGEWLYWRAREGGTEYAIRRSNTSPGVLTHAAAKKVEFNWKSGYRVGFGVHLPRCGWDIYLNYTNIFPHKTSSVHGSVFPLLAFQEQFPTANVASAQARWSINYQTLDLEFGRAYRLAKSLGLRPYIGGKGAYIKQHMHFKYAGGDIPPGENFKIRDHNRFMGGGVRAGVNSNWTFGAGFSFAGNIAAALLVGEFDVKQDQFQEGVSTIALKSNFNLLTPTVQMNFSLAWDWNFGRDRYHFGLIAGFETQYWWRQNQMERFTDSATPIYIRPGDDLAFYGFTAGGRFDF